MEQCIFQTYTAILKEELVPALGCTEPIAIALASARARQVLEAFPERITVRCSGNIIKNAKSVIVPTTGDMRGIDTSAVLGAVAGDPTLELEVLSRVTPEDVERTRRLLAEGLCTVELLDSDAPLHIRMEMWGGGHSAAVEIRDRHTNVTRIERDGAVLLHRADRAGSGGGADRSLLRLEDIWTYAREAELEQFRTVIERQIGCNQAISREGLEHEYGACVGRTLLRCQGDDVHVRAKAAAAAGSDARMGGCVLPVVINSGSGNQGMTVALPLIVYAEHLGKGEEELLRALAFANLVALLQKREIGRLSAFCGAVCAAVGAGAGIAFLSGEGLEVIRRTIVNTLGNVSGLVCDGAKASCAAKIAAAVDAALLGYDMAREGKRFSGGDGIVKESAEATVDSVGRMARTGMKETDRVILEIMLDKAEGQAAG